MTTTEPLTPNEPEAVPVAVAWARCLADIGSVGKQRSAGVTYAFRSIDTLMNVAHPVFARHGIAVVPQGGRIAYAQHERQNKGSQSTWVWIEAGFLIVGPMGDTISGGGFGEGFDVSDKATNKAAAASFKYFLMQALCIPLDDIADSDREPVDNGEPASSGRTTTRSRATTTRPAAARGGNRTRPARGTQDEPENAAPEPPPVELPVGQQRLLDRIGGMPEAHRKVIAAHLKAERVSLRREVDPAVIKTVTEFLDSMPDTLP